MSERAPGRSTSWGGYVAISAIALAFAFLPGLSPYFAWLLGDLNPPVVVLLVAALGAACLAALQVLGGFEIRKRGQTYRGIAVGFALATLLGIAIAIADTVFRYPEDMNAPMPHALAFYPSIGLVAEIAFHLLPLTVILLLLLPFRKRLGRDRSVLAAIVLVAIAEPTFQVLFGGERPPLAVYTWIHVFAIALLQLYVFRRYDFVSMYSMRLSYYLYWHILWGVLRLRLLF